MLDQIARNIRDHGYHVYVVSGGPTPRWIYTIGLSPSLGFELVFAGGATYSKDAVLEILNTTVNRLKSKLGAPSDTTGLTRIGPVCAEWASHLLIGTHDYYQTQITAVQVIPDAAPRTLDVPDLSVPLSLEQATPWQWLVKTWPYNVSKHSEVMTDTKVLTGSPVLEAARWEEQYWEAFAGPSDEVNQDDACLVPLGTLLGLDPTLALMTRLNINSGMRRNVDAAWQFWEK